MLNGKDKARVLFIFANGESEVMNRKSALGSYIFCLATLLNEHDFDVRINTTPVNDIHISESAPLTNTSRFGIGKFVPKFIKGMIRDNILFRRNHALLSRIKNAGFVPDIVIEFYSYGSDIGLECSVYYHRPLFVVFDAPVLEEYRYFYGRKVINRSKILSNQNNTLKASSVVNVYSDSVKKYVEQHVGADKQITIHQNVDFSRFEFISSKPFCENMTIGFIGSFLKWHRVDLLLKAYEVIRSKGINCDLLLVGSGMEENAIKNMVDSHPYKKEIRLTGYLDGNELTMEKSKMHIGVMPGSNWYGAPNKIFEYGIAGMAVVAPNTPTIYDIFGSNKDVLLFEQNNVEELSKSLIKLLTDENFYIGMANGLQEKINQYYSAENTLNYYTGIIDKLVTPPNRSN